MTGYVLAQSACLGCGRFFAYNPVYVPSTSAITGTREPLCSGCMAAINAKRHAKGLEPFLVHPEAYEPLPEGELP